MRNPQTLCIPQRKPRADAIACYGRHSHKTPFGIGYPDLICGKQLSRTEHTRFPTQGPHATGTHKRNGGLGIRAVQAVRIGKRRKRHIRQNENGSVVHRSHAVELASIRRHLDEAVLPSHVQHLNPQRGGHGVMPSKMCTNLFQRQHPVSRQYKSFGSASPRTAASIRQPIFHAHGTPVNSPCPPSLRNPGLIPPRI